MDGASKKFHRSRKRSTKGAKLVISVAALAVTFGGWAAMTANDEWAAAVQAQQSTTISTIQTSAQSGFGTHPIGDAAVSITAAQPPAPFVITRSSR